jgi:ADP-ribose pyrophosphatase YjhB (NUDIX family)
MGGKDNSGGSTRRKHVTCAGCVVYRIVSHGHEILLIKPRHDSEKWGIPKGHVDHDERIIDCAIRETWEETGLACMPEIPLEPVHTINPREYKTVYAYVSRCLGPDEPAPIMKHEVDEVKWWSINALPPIHKYQIPLLQQAVHIISNMPQ